MKEHLSPAEVAHYLNLSLDLLILRPEERSEPLRPLQLSANNHTPRMNVPTHDPNLNIRDPRNLR
jgi:hypothetical protein